MKLKIVTKGGSGSGNFGHEGRPGKVGGSRSHTVDQRGPRDEKPITGFRRSFKPVQRPKADKPVTIPQGMGRTNPDKDWNAALEKADKRAYGEISSVIPDIELRERISGDTVQEPRIYGKSKSNFASISQSIKAAGWKSPAKFNKPDKQTFVHPDGHQVTVSKYKDSGGANVGYIMVSYLPTYPMGDFYLP